MHQIYHAVGTQIADMHTAASAISLADVAMLDAEPGSLGIFLRLGHAVPLRIDIYSHSIGDEDC
jgi:hypothetical protein